MAERVAYNGKGTIFFDCLPFETGGKFAVWRIARKDKRICVILSCLEERDKRTFF